MFNPDSWVFGVGFAPYANGYTMVYVDPGYVIDYSIPNGCHFDQRIKINSGDYDSDEKYLTFMMQYFNTNGIQAKNVYLAYQNSLTLMDLAFGNSTNSFYRVNFEVPDHCEPYFFIVETNKAKNRYFRLPESEQYFFGTAWSNWRYIGNKKLSFVFFLFGCKTNYIFCVKCVRFCKKYIFFACVNF